MPDSGSLDSLADDSDSLDADDELPLRELDELVDSTKDADFRVDAADAADRL